MAWFEGLVVWRVGWMRYFFFFPGSRLLICQGRAMFGLEKSPAWLGSAHWTSGFPLSRLFLLLGHSTTPFAQSPSDNSFWISAQRYQGIIVNDAYVWMPVYSRVVSAVYYRKSGRVFREEYRDVCRVREGQRRAREGAAQFLARADTGGFFLLRTCLEIRNMTGFIGNMCAV